jgi:hypothetical protein
MGPRRPQAPGPQAGAAGEHAAQAEHHRRQHASRKKLEIFFFLMPVDKRVKASTATDRTRDGPEALDLSGNEEAVAACTDRWSGEDERGGSK